MGIAFGLASCIPVPASIDGIVVRRFCVSRCAARHIALQRENFNEGFQPGRRPAVCDGLLPRARPIANCGCRKAVAAQVAPNFPLTRRV